VDVHQVELKPYHPPRIMQTLEFPEVELHTPDLMLTITEDWFRRELYISALRSAAHGYADARRELFMQSFVDV
jgi:hypothetical protein